MKKFILGIVLFLAPAMLSASEVYDGARMFSDSTKASVVEKLNKLEADSGVETIVETFPQSSRSSFNGDSDKNRFFQDWLVNAAKSRGARGVYVLICKSPGRVQVDFSKSLFERGIPIANTSFVRDAALNRLKAKDTNGALVAIADTVDSMFAPKLEAAASKPLVIPVPVFTEHKPVVVPVVPDPVPPVPQPVPAPVVLPGEEESNFLFYAVIIGLGACGVGFVAWVFWLILRKDETFSSGVSLQSDSLSYNIPTTKCQECGAQTNTNPCAYCKAEVDWKPKTVASVPSSPTKVVNVTHVHNDGGVDPLLAGVVGYELGRSSVPAKEYPHPEQSKIDRARESSYSSSDDSYSSSSSHSSRSSDDSSSSFFGGSGGDWGSSSSDSSFGGGGDFGGGSGGDF